MWNSHGKDNAADGSWCEYNPALEAMRGKLKWPYHLTAFVAYEDPTGDEDATEAPEADDAVEETPGRSATPEEQARIAAFHESLIGRLGPEDNALLVGRCWHLGAVQLEFRVQDPVAANAALEAIGESKEHEFAFQYQMFPDGGWTVPKKFWSGDIIAEDCPGTSDDDHDEYDDEDEEVMDADGFSPVSAGDEDLDDEEEEEVDPEVELAALAAELCATTGEDRIPLWCRQAELLHADKATLPQAESVIAKGLAEYPDSLELLSMHGAVALSMGKLELARASLSRALEVNELSGYAYYTLAAVEATAGNPDDAMAALKNCLLIDPILSFHAQANENLASLRDREDFKELTSGGLCVGPRSGENEYEETLLIVIPGNIPPLERGEKYEDPLDDFLNERFAGTVVGGNTRIVPGGSEEDAASTIEVGCEDLEETAVAVLDFFAMVKPPAGTRIYPGAQVGDKLDPKGGIAVE